MKSIWKTIELSSGNLKLQLLPGIGGRLWDVVYKGRSLLFKNPDLFDQVPEIDKLTDLPTKSPQFRFPLWGGEKTWIAPDTSWIDDAPFPMLDSGSYKVVSRDASHVRMRSPMCPASQIVVEREIRIGTDETWSVRHGIINSGPTDRYAGIWSVLMLNRPTSIGLLTESPQITPVFGDASAHIQSGRSSIICNCHAKTEFKVGTNNPTGRVFLRFSDHGTKTWLACSTSPTSPGEQFAHGHNFEVFNSGDYAYCEAEWHAPARHLKPRESAEFTQNFTVWSGPKPPASIDITTPELELLKCMS